LIHPTRLGLEVQSATAVIAIALGMVIVKDTLQAPGDTIPWTLLSNGGAVLAVLFTVWFFVRFCSTLISECRAERESKEKSHREEREAALARMDNVAATVGAAVKESNARLEGAVLDLARDLRNNQRGTAVPPGG
jgi:Na+-transporting methylmalonyl-CoA/oxaloacetate decarboxylase gamma subunit